MTGMPSTSRDSRKSQSCFVQTLWFFGMGRGYLQERLPSSSLGRTCFLAELNNKAVPRCDRGQRGALSGDGEGAVVQASDRRANGA